MNRIQKQCNPVQGIAWGQVPTLALQIGPRYRMVTIEVIVQAAAGKIVQICDVLDLITIKGNGNPWRTHRAWELDQVHRSYGAQYAYNVYNYTGGQLHFTNGSGVPDGPVAGGLTIFEIPIFFREPWRSSYAVKDMFCWPTAWPNGSILSSLTMELTVPPASINIATNAGVPVPPVINVYSEIDNQLGSMDKATGKTPVMLINRWERNGAVYGGQGNLVITTIPKKNLLSQISFFAAYALGAGGAYVGPIPGNTPAKMLTDQNAIGADGAPLFDAVTYAKVSVNNIVVRDMLKVNNDQLLVDEDFNESALPPDRYDLVFDKSDRPDDALALSVQGTPVNDFTVTITIGLPGKAVVAGNQSVTMLSQTFGPPPGGQ